MKNDFHKLAMTRILCVIGLVTVAVASNDFAMTTMGVLIFLAGLVERLVIAIVDRK